MESRTLLTAGQLDPTFGTGGYAHYDFPQAQQVGANVVLIDSEGRVVAAGGGTNSNAIARYLPNAMMDSTFGNGGRVMLAATNPIDDGVILPDGKLLFVTGVSYIDDGAIRVLRLNSDGSPDTTFAPEGYIDWPWNPVTSAHLAVQADGKMVIAGESQTTVVIARLNGDGSLDTTFAANGRCFYDLHANARPREIEIGADGSILVLAGTSLIMLDGDGKLQGDFGSAGIVDLSGLLDSNGRFVRDAGGDIMVGGTFNNDMAIVRVLPDGQVDSAFGNAGRITLDFNNSVDWLADLVALPDGRFIAAGTENQDPAGVMTGSDIALAAFTSNWQLDTSFGMGGKFTIDIAMGDDMGTAAALAPNGDIVVVGRRRAD